MSYILLYESDHMSYILTQPFFRKHNFSAKIYDQWSSSSWLLLLGMNLFHISQYSGFYSFIEAYGLCYMICPCVWKQVFLKQISVTAGMSLVSALKQKA